MQLSYGTPVVTQGTCTGGRQPPSLLAYQGMAGNTLIITAAAASLTRKAESLDS